MIGRYHGIHKRAPLASICLTGGIVLAVVALGSWGCRTADQALFAGAEDAYRRGALVRAESLFTVYLEHEPNDADGWYNRALARSGIPDLPGAMSDLDRTLQLSDGDRDARWMRFQIRELQIEAAQEGDGRWDAERSMRRTWITALRVLQLEELTGILERDPCDVSARCERGILWRRSGRPAEAYMDLTLALRCDPADVRSLTERGNLLHAAGKYDDALKDYASAFDACDTCLWLLYNEALSFRAAGRLREAVSVLEKLVAADSTDGEAWLTLGDCRSDLGRLNAACAAWQRSKRLGVAEARVRLGLHCNGP